MATTGDVRSLIEYLSATFPSMSLTYDAVTAWEEHLARFSPYQLKQAANHFIENSGSAFGPTVPQLLQALRDSRTSSQPARFRGLPAPEMSEETKNRQREEARAKHPELFR